MAHVFISYAHADAEFVKGLRDQIADAGFEVWIDDERLKAGEDWRQAIDDAIKMCVALIAVMTPEAYESKYVTYEWACAWGAEISVIPVLLKSTKTHPRMEAWQYIDFTHRPKWSKVILRLQEVEQNSKSKTTISVDKNAPPAVKKAVEALDSHNPSERENAIKSLEQINNPTARETLIQATQHNIQDVRLNSAEVLSRKDDFDDERALPGLVETYQMDKLSLTGRVKTLQLIKKYNYELGLEVAMRGFTSHEVATQTAGAEALDSLGLIDERIVPKLLKVIEAHETPEQKQSAIRLIHKYWKQALPALVNTFDLNDAHVQGAAWNLIFEISRYNQDECEIVIKELERAHSDPSKFTSTKFEAC